MNARGRRGDIHRRSRYVLDKQAVQLAEEIEERCTLPQVGSGFGIDSAMPSIETVYEIRNSAPIGLKGDYHPFLKKLK